MVGRQSDVVRQAANIAENGSQDIKAAQRKALDAITEAEEDGFRVGDDLAVTDTQRADISTIGARHTVATEHAENIRWNAEQLAQADAHVGERLQTKAVELEAIRFDGETDKRDDRVRLVDNEIKLDPPPPGIHPTPSEKNFTDIEKFIYNEMSHNANSRFTQDTREKWESGIWGKYQAAVQLKEAFKVNGIWDHKPTIQRKVGIYEGDGLYFQQPGTNRQVFYDIYSNIHYGYVARAAGLPESVIELAPTLNNGDTGVTDDGDIITVAAGIAMFDKYGADMTEAGFHTAFLDTINQLDAAKQDGKSVSLNYGYK